MAAGVTPAVEALTAVLTEAVAQSRILQALDKIIGQTLGLLVDLILLPFLPILIWVLKGLLAWVIDFGKWWNDFWKGDGKILLDALKVIAGYAGDLLKMAIDFSLKPIGAFYELGAGFLKWLWSIATGAPAAVDIAFKAVGEVYDFLKWLWDAVKSTAGALMNLAFSLPGFVGSAIEWLWNLAKGAIDFIKELKFEIPEPIKGILEWLKGIAETGLRITADIVGTLAGGAKDLAKNILASVGIDIPWLAKGGTIAETGVAVVHKGETVVPAGQGGAMSVSISGTLFRDEEEMYQRVFDRIRAELWRQNV